MTETAVADERCNVADRLTVHAAERPDSVAVVAPHRGAWRDVTFAQIDADANTLAHGLVAMGVRPGHRIALLVKPGIEFVTLVFALLRSGATMVLVDAGLGRKNIIRCLESTNPDGFVAIPPGHALRVLMRKKFPNAKLNVTVGRRWFWGGETLASLRKLGASISSEPKTKSSAPPTTSSEPPTLVGGVEAEFAPPTNVGGSLQLSTQSALASLPLTTANDPAAIVFTSGSTGPPKGVLYRHETFTTQCEQIQQQYDLQPGVVDLACFPLFGLFNVACGITTVLPEMDFSRPASCNPKKLFTAANEWKVSQSFASPAVWDRLSRHAEETGDHIPTLKKIFSCGAPVPAKVIRRTLKMVAPGAELHTPYGATESLPVATIEAQEILAETAAKTDEGAGVCVGKRFDNVEWRVIRITDDPIATIDDTEELPQGEIGELIVRAPQVSREYLEPRLTTQTEKESYPLVDTTNIVLPEWLKRHCRGVVRFDAHNVRSKIKDKSTVWHRIGDVGYFDDQERFWYCGRKSQRVWIGNATLFTECVEARVNSLRHVNRSALVAVPTPSWPDPHLVVEIGFDLDEALELLEDGVLGRIELRDLVEKEIRREVAADPSLCEIVSVLFHPKLPTDIRHNSKINREQLAEWAAKQLVKKR